MFLLKDNAGSCHPLVSSVAVTGEGVATYQDFKVEDTASGKEPRVILAKTKASENGQKAAAILAYNHKSVDKSAVNYLPSNLSRADTEKLEHYQADFVLESDQFTEDDLRFVIFNFQPPAMNEQAQGRVTPGAAASSKPPRLPS